MQQPTPPAPPRLAQGIAAPQSRSQLDALSQLRAELRDQRSALTKERAELFVQQRMGAGGAELSGRLAELDARRALLDQRIASADEAIAAGIQRGLGVSTSDEGPAAVVTIPPLDTGLGKTVGNIMAANALSILLTAVIVWGIARRRLRGAGAAPAIADQARRLDQLQSAVDTMAVEVERISEGQRYVTKVLSERLPATTDRPS